MLALGFALIILIGALLLSLPFATKSRECMPFLDALFTATSATCVTGLVVADTYQNWSLFGQLVILTLIQIGGLGFITIGSYIAVVMKKKIGLKERTAIHESVSTMELAGVVRLVRKIVMGTFAFELAGALLLSLRFVPQYGLLRGCYMGLFHAVSAFCNAGFDLMGINEAYSSLVSYEGDILVNFTVMALIIIGGTGFLVWDDIQRNGLRFKKYLLHTKIVLITTAVLIFGGALLFYLLEKDNVFAGMSGKEQLLGALFSAVTPRTAGFNSVDTYHGSDVHRRKLRLHRRRCEGDHSGGHAAFHHSHGKGNPWSKYTKQAPGRGYGKKSQRHRHYRFKPGGSRRADYYGCTAPEAYGHAF